MQKKLLSTPENTNGAKRSSGRAHAIDNINPCNVLSLAQRLDTEASEQDTSLPNEQCRTPTARSNLINSNANTNLATVSKGNERKSIADVLKTRNECKELVGEKWNLVSNKKRKKPTSIGKIGKAYVGPSEKFKAAVIKVPLFISNVCKNTNESDIIAYIKDSTQEDVILFKINRKTEKRYNSFKLYVPITKLELFLDNKFWPDGITFRRFVNETSHSKSKTGVIKQTSSQ